MIESDLKNALWVERYRPHKINDCILPNHLKQTFQEYINKKEVPNLLFCGSAGTGKTTVAKVLCDEIGLDYTFINGSEENGIDILRVKIRQYASTISLSGGKKVIIVDECDYMNANSLQPALRGAIEEFSKNCSFIFTCNYKNRIIEPLHSRCAVIEFKLTNKEKAGIAAQFFGRVLSILEKENITYDKQVITELVMKYFPDFRRTLNELQRYSASGHIGVEALAQVKGADITGLVAFLKEKDFPKVRQWVNTNSDNDPNRVYRRIYDGLNDMVKPQSIPQVVLILAKYQYQAAFSLDGEVNLLACLVEIMIESEFK